MRLKRQKNFTGERGRIRVAMVFLVLLVTLLYLTSYRMAAASTWLPTMPTSLDGMTLQPHPVDQNTLIMLGNPKGTAGAYGVPDARPIEVTMVTGGMFENYHDPTACVGQGQFETLGIDTVDIAAGQEKAIVRRLSFRHRENPDIRMVMYYWQQRKSGSIDYRARMGNFRDMPARVEHGWSTLLNHDPTVIVRTYVMFDGRSVEAVEEAKLAGISAAIVAQLRLRQ
jgi:hypothetical protein